jgi:Na+/H+ antiporter NhaC
MKDFGILSLAPTVIIISIALLTHRIIPAMCLGIISGVFILDHKGFFFFIKSLWHYFYITFSDTERLKIALFLFLVGGLIGIISDSGAYIEFAKRLTKYLNSLRKVRLTTFILGILIFFDDYASVLIAGTSMRSITEEKKISPALMAYIVDSVATVVSITVLSTWSAFESSLMVSAAETAGIKNQQQKFFLHLFHITSVPIAAFFLLFL